MKEGLSIVMFVLISHGKRASSLSFYLFSPIFFFSFLFLPFVIFLLSLFQPTSDPSFFFFSILVFPVFQSILFLSLQTCIFFILYLSSIHPCLSHPSFFFHPSLSSISFQANPSLSFITYLFPLLSPDPEITCLFHILPSFLFSPSPLSAFLPSHIHSPKS